MIPYTKWDVYIKKYAFNLNYFELNISMQAKSTVTVKKSQDLKEVVCDGGAGALGHPKVYLPFGKKSEVICYYCGKRFQKTRS